MTTIELTSIGQLSGHLQHHVTEIRRACEELGILPAYRLNGVAYYSSQDCKRIAEYFRRRSSE